MFVLVCLKQWSLGESLLPCFLCCLSHSDYSLTLQCLLVRLWSLKMHHLSTPSCSIYTIKWHAQEVSKCPVSQCGSIKRWKMSHSLLSPLLLSGEFCHFSRFSIQHYWDKSNCKRESPSIASVRDIFVPCLQQYLQAYWDFPPTRSVVVSYLLMREGWVLFGLFCGVEEGPVGSQIYSKSLNKQNHFSCLFSLPPGFCNWGKRKISSRKTNFC